MAPPKALLLSAVSKFFEYDTPRIVHIRSKKVGIINRFIQLVIIGYIIGYVIVYKKGYQEFDNVQSAVTTKVKGIIFSNDSDIGTRTWDVADYVIPPQEANAFFVMTNVHPTLLQTQTTCPESISVSGAQCQSDEYCQKLLGTILPKGNGPVTGSCVPSGYGNVSVCSIFGWCPVENNVTFDARAFLASANFTVFIKNNIEFPKFDVTRRNLPEPGSIQLPENVTSIDAYLNSCMFNGDNPRDKYCPIFRLETIVNGAGVTYENISQEGGVMQIIIDWTCDLDYSENSCLPEYSFRRLDKGDYSISKGFNFRYADHFAMMVNDTSVMYRNLYKATGIRFLVTVQGQAGQFRIVPLLLNIGSGMALLGIATVLCDFVVLYLLKARAFYKEKKYLDVKGQDAFEVLREDSESKTSNEVKRRNQRLGEVTDANGSDA
ncbi:unnamed protein product [Candidula unifasciata]|uniref:P2X purinoceptor n=1 Tax=Candidula unifasciata TaxID=100452 RepID=A0A8S4A1Z2_9EUPU|nr:unnamed protein product [Candidula unifasciata]